jgi:glutathione peroxidase
MTLPTLDLKTIENQTEPLSQYQGQVLLVVNVASRCGFTSQYKGLQALYEQYKEQGFSVLGFPCNQFGSQEPGDEASIQAFCETNYHVTFPMFAKVDVNGNETDPFFKWLKSSKPGILGTEAIKWNFTKFLLGRDGQVIKRYGSNDAPSSIAADIENALLQST